MATVGLKYSLEIELSNARKQLERFKKEMGEGLNSMGKRRRGGDDAYGPFLPTAAQIRQSLNNIEREAKRAQKGGSYGPFLPTASQIRQSLGIMERESKRTSKGGGYGPFLPTAAQIRQSLNVIERETKRAQRTQKSETYGPFMPTAAQIRESLRAQERAAEQAARARQQAAREAERDAERLASRLDAINAGRMRANSMGGFTSPDAVNIEKQARAKMLAELTNLEVNANKMGAYAFQEKMRQIHSSFSQAIHQMKSAQADFTNQQNINNSGLNFSRAFQGQQMVEDFAIGYQLNGMQGALRGATNNLSFLGASVGGPLGVTALIASLGLTLANTTGLFDRFTKGSERAAAALERLQSVRAQQREDQESFGGLDIGSESGMDAAGAAQAHEQAMARAEARQAQIKEQLRLLESLQSVSRQLAAVDALAGFFSGGAAKDDEEQAKLRETQKSLQKSLDALPGVKGTYDVNMIGGVSGIDSAKESLEDINTELAEMEAHKQHLADVRSILQSMQQSGSAIKLSGDRLGALDAKGEAGKEAQGLAESVYDRMQEERANKLAALQQRLATAKTVGGRDGLEQEKAILEEIQVLEEGYVIAASALFETTKKQVDLDNWRVDTAEKLGDEVEAARKQQEESLAIVQEQAQAARELAQVEDQRLETIKEQRRVQREQFEASVFEARKGIRGAEAERDEDNLEKQADSARERVRRRADQLRARLAIGSRNLSRQGARGAGGRDMRADISQAGAWIDQQEQAYLQNIEREEERRRTGITARRDADIQKMNADRENLLKQRAGGLSGQAQEAFSAGQFDRARQLIDQSRGALQELQALQMQQVGEGTPEQMRAALDRATATQQQMDQTFGLEAQVTTASRDAALQAFQQNVNLADQYEKELQQIKALQDSLKDAEFIKQLEVDRAKQIRDYFTEIANIATRTQVAGAVAEASGDSLVAPSLFQGALEQAKVPALPPSAGATGPVSNFAPNVTINQAGGSAVGIIAELALQGLFTGIRAGR